jgi:hypothetical protein
MAQDGKRGLGWGSVLLVLLIGGLWYRDYRGIKAEEKARIIAQQQQKAKEEQARAEAERQRKERENKKKEEDKAEVERLHREVVKAMGEWRAAWECLRKEDEKTAEEDLLRECLGRSRDWTDTKGRKIEAKFAGSSGEFVDLRYTQFVNQTFDSPEVERIKKVRKSSLCDKDQALIRKFEELPEFKAQREQTQAGTGSAEQQRVPETQALSPEQQIQNLYALANKTPPDEEASVQFITQLTNQKVQERINAGQLISANGGKVLFSRLNDPLTPRDDARIDVLYDFVFKTQAGLIRQNQGFYVWVHAKRGAWRNTDINIDGLPRY